MRVPRIDTVLQLARGTSEAPLQETRSGEVRGTDQSTAPEGPAYLTRMTIRDFGALSSTFLLNDSNVGVVALHLIPDMSSDQLQVRV